MTPQEHYDEAERLLQPLPKQDNAGRIQHYARPHPADVARADVHARLALAGFTRDLPGMLDYDARRRAVEAGDGA